MFVFYSKELSESHGLLSEEELHHCVNVLRRKDGDQIFVTNGIGTLAKGKISRIKKSELIFEVISSAYQEEDPIKNGIFLSPPKSSDRLEWFIEKSIEIGIKEISLFECTRTERAHVNLKRLEKIAISAMKQSKQYYLPSIKYFQKFKDVIIETDHFENKLIAFCEEKQMHINSSIGQSNNVIMIGPEGDFTTEEIELAKNNGFTSVSLGKTILRTETAGVFAASLFESKKQ